MNRVTSWRAKSAATALVALVVNCGTPAMDEPAIESVDPQGLTWVAPIQQEQAEANAPIEMTVYTENPGVQSMHFVVDGVEVGSCRRAPSVPTPIPPVFEGGVDPDPGASPTAAADETVPLENNPANPYEPAATFDDGDLPPEGEEAISTVPDEGTGFDDDENTLPDEDIPDEDSVAAEMDAPDECLANNVGSWSTTISATGMHTLSAWFDTPDGRRVQTSRTITIVDRLTDDEMPPLADGTETLVQGDGHVEDRNFGFHRPFSEGREWSVERHVVKFRTGRLHGNVRTIARCMGAYGASFRRYRIVASEASLVATAYAYSRCMPGRRPGLSGLNASRCATLAGLPQTDAGRHECLHRMRTIPDFAIGTSAQNLASLRRVHHYDPVLMAVALQSGAVRRSSRGPWRMRASQSFITRFVQGYNAYRAWSRDPRYHPQNVRDLVPQCPNAAGSHPGTEIEARPGDLAALRTNIQHILFITQENHSFDAMFGHTPRAGVDRLPRGYSNPDDRANARTVRPFHITTGCPRGPYHSPEAAEAEWNFGRMNGFAAHAGSFHRGMGFYTDRDHPFYTWLYNTFATGDRYFSARLGDTALNRHYMLFGKDALDLSDDPSIIHRLVELGIAVNSYRGSPAGEALLPILGGRQVPIANLRATLRGDAGATPLATPSVGWFRFPASEHPPDSDMHEGENEVREVITALMSGPYWANSVLIMNYDEGGGFHDHVAPSLACAPGGGLERRGFRTPLYVVSPFARRGFVSHRTHDHTSMLRFLEARFDIGALTRRDANADALLDLFDFARPDASVPASVPAAHPLDSRCPHAGM